jgi:hypothetical protein
MGSSNTATMSDLIGAAARLRKVRAARRRFLVLWALQGAADIKAHHDGNPLQARMTSDLANRTGRRRFTGD